MVALSTANGARARLAGVALDAHAEGGLRATRLGGEVADEHP
jgi:hypothetical protein